MISNAFFASMLIYELKFKLISWINYHYFNHTCTNKICLS